MLKIIAECLYRAELHRNWKMIETRKTKIEKKTPKIKSRKSKKFQ